MSDKQKNSFKFSTTHIILLGFLCTILIGSLLLSLPFATKNGITVSYVDALFTATTATCVTGLVTVTTATTWSGFGQAVILLLIQIGGLGVITILAFFFVFLNKKVSGKNSRLIQDALNLNSLSGIKSFIKKVALGTAIIEMFGAMLYLPVFLPEFGARGVWVSIFTSVSAFCNAGIDIIGTTSLYAYATHPLINFTTSFLIVLGGLGYIVWWDVIYVMKKWRTHKWRAFQFLTLHSKIVLTATFTLVFGGAIAVLILEYNNPLTLGNYGLFDKIQISFFQSITTRTAGFASIPQEHLTDATAIICIVLMLIGGSPVGTAGGIKTVTFVVLFASIFSTIRNKEEPTLFQRTLSKQTTKKALAVAGIFITILFTSTLLLCVACPAPFLDVLFETVSAAATVGLSRNLTPFLNLAGKYIVIVTMFAGRIGPLSLFVAFITKKQTENNIKHPTEEISVG